MTVALPPVETSALQRSRALQALLAAVAAAILLGALFVASSRGLRWAVMTDRPYGLTLSYAFMLGTIALVWLLPATRRRLTLAALGLVAYAVVLGPGAAAIAAFVAAVCGIARLPIKLRYQLLLALVAWAALPSSRYLVWPPAWRHGSFTLGVVWAGLAYSAVFLLIERQRRANRGTLTLVDEVFYLTALPRLAEPFFQPISPRYLFAQQRENLTLNLVLRGLALGFYGLGLAVLSGFLRDWRPGDAPMVRRMAINYVGYYCVAANQVFVSMALFRLLGFDVASGYRLPLLARSFADFFRRWNHYVRDAVLSLFFYPFLGRLRLLLPRKAATVVAAYAAIVVGSLLLNDLLIPVATSLDPFAGARRALDAQRLVSLVIFWTAIILPRLTIVPRPDPKRASNSRWRRIAATARFLALYFAVWCGSWWLRQQRRRSLPPFR